MLNAERANGERYPRVGGRRGRHFAGTSLQPRELLENAATPTRRVHAVLGGVLANSSLSYSNQDPFAIALVYPVARLLYLVLPVQDRGQECF